MLRGVGMAYDRGEGDRYPLGPCEVSAACLFLSDQARLAGLDLSLFPVGVGMARGHELLRGVRLRQRKGVMVDPSLSVWTYPCGLARPQLFGLILASAPCAARAVD